MTYSEKLKDPRWQKKRLKILERDAFACRLCGDDKSTLHIHHISYGKDPWSIKDELLITLCEDCHKEESEYLKESPSELIKALKNSGFMAIGFVGLSKVFSDTDRGWSFYEPAFDIIKMVIDDDELWFEMNDKFWTRLKLKMKGGKF